MENIPRERRHEHRIRPSENPDDSEERQNGEDAPVTPNVTKSFESLAERARFTLDRRVFRQPHQEESGNDGDEAEAIEQEAHGNSDLRHEKPGDRRTNNAGAVERGTVERD